MDNLSVGLIVVVILVVIYEAYAHLKPKLKQVVPARSVPPVSMRVSEPSQPRPVPPAPPPEPTNEELRATLAAATTVEDALDVYNSVPSGSPIEPESIARIVAILSAMCESAATIDDCWAVYRASEDASLDWDETNAVVMKALRKAAGLVGTFEDAKSLFEDLEDEGIDDEAFKGAVLDQAIALGTFNELIELSDELDESYSGFEKQEDALLERAFSLVENADDCQKIVDRTGHELEERAMLRKVDFLTCVEDCQEIWDDKGVDSDIGMAAICRAADIIRRRAERLLSSAQTTQA